MCYSDLLMVQGISNSKLIMNIEYYSNFMTIIHCYMLFRFADGAFKLKYQI